jgi:hypothetical protein
MQKRNNNETECPQCIDAPEMEISGLNETRAAADG